MVVKKTAPSTATRSITRLGRQVRAEPHPRHRRSNVSSPAATNGLEKSGARWRIRTIQKYFRGAIRSRISSVHSIQVFRVKGSAHGMRLGMRHASAAATASKGRWSSRAGVRGRRSLPLPPVRGMWKPISAYRLRRPARGRRQVRGVGFTGTLPSRDVGGCLTFTQLYSVPPVTLKRGSLGLPLCALYSLLFTPGSDRSIYCG